MKKQAMSLAVTAALLGGTVSAYGSMYINDQGLGETLIYPFYSSASGNDTYVHVVNTTDYTKAVKVRFIEARNSDEVLDFNLYLSPQDEWAGVITSNPNPGPNGEGAIIRTVDNSCTVPALGTGSGPLGGSQEVLPNGKTLRDQPFVNYEYLDDSQLNPNAETGLVRTTEGYIEIIEMGQLDPSFGLGAAAVHNAAGVPANCNALVNAWSNIAGVDGTWLVNSQAQLLTTWMGGGLYGFGVLINVEKGTAVGMDAVAIEGFADTTLGSPDLHSEPGDTRPGLENATNLVTIFNDAMATEYTMDNGIDAVSALFQSQGIANDYVIDPDIDASTDWVITMPTKSEYTQGAPNGTAIPPFSRNWNGVNACEPVSLVSWDREEAFEPPGSDGPIFSPAPPSTPVGPDLTICTEVSVITYAADSAVGASSAIRYGYSPEDNEGWAYLDFLTNSLVSTLPADARMLTDQAGTTTFEGLPVTGFAVFQYVNGTLDGGSVLANYAASVEHKTEKLITTTP